MSKSDRFRRLAENREAENSISQKHEVIEKIIGDFEPHQNEEDATHIHEQSSHSLLSNNNNENSSETLNSNNNNEQLDVSLVSNSVTEQSNVIQKRKTTDTARIPKPIEEFEKRLKKPTIEETHTRGTWLIRNDLLKRLDKLSKHQQRGFKTHLVNYALEQVLNELEGK